MGVWITNALLGTTVNGLVVAEPVPIAYAEKEQYKYDGKSATARLRVPWVHRYAIMADIVDNRNEWPYRTGIIPWPLLAQSADIEPVKGSKTSGPVSSLHVYDQADIVVTYGTSLVNTVAGTGSPGGGGGSALYVENVSTNIEAWDIEPSGQFISYWDETTGKDVIVPYWFRWGEEYGSELLETPPRRIRMGFDYSITWHGLSSVPAAAWSMQGKVNDDELTSILFGKTFDIGHMLCTGVSVSKTQPVWGVAGISLTINLSNRGSDWNKTWRFVDNSYQDIWLHIGDARDEATQEEPVIWKQFAETSMRGVMP
jgi:hypothetical protein